MRTGSWRASIVLLMVIAMLALPGAAARAAFPDANGLIVFVREYPVTVRFVIPHTFELEPNWQAISH
jgi:hypothetical protein